MIQPKDIKNGMQVYCKDGHVVGTVDMCETDGKTIKLKRDVAGATHWLKTDAIATMDTKGLHLKTNAMDAKKAFVTKAPPAAAPAA